MFYLHPNNYTASESRIGFFTKEVSIFLKIYKTASERIISSGKTNYSKHGNDNCLN